MLSIHHSPPDFTEHDAGRIAFDVYGMHVRARALPGEHDRNSRTFGLLRGLSGPI